MVIGILQFDLHIHGAESLKDKRRVVSSVKDRLHREHLISIAEVALQDRASVARLGLALVGTDGEHVGRTLDRICAKLREVPGAELGDVSREILHGSGLERADDGSPREGHALDAEMLSRAEQADSRGREGAG